FNSVNPGGSDEPGLTDHEYGGVPPLTSDASSGTLTNGWPTETCPGKSVVKRLINGTGLPTGATTSVKVPTVIASPVESVTIGCTVKLPACCGVPERTPSGLRARPGGSGLNGDSANEYGGFPPATLRAYE